MFEQMNVKQISELVGRTDATIRNWIKDISNNEYNNSLIVQLKGFNNYKINEGQSDESFFKEVRNSIIAKYEKSSPRYPAVFNFIEVVFIIHHGGLNVLCERLLRINEKASIDEMLEGKLLDDTKRLRELKDEYRKIYRANLTLLKMMFDVREEMKTIRFEIGDCLTKERFEIMMTAPGTLEDKMQKFFSRSRYLLKDESFGITPKDRLQTFDYGSECLSDREINTILKIME